MSRLTKVAAGICSVGMVAALSAPLMAQAREDGQRGPRGRHGAIRGGVMRGFEGLPLRSLELTDAQREQVRGIRQARQEEFRALGERLRAARQAEHAAVVRVPVDENEVRARASELAAVQADFAVLRARVHEQVYQVLTPEQQETAKTLAAERQKRRAERIERMKERWQQRQQQRQQQ